MQMMVTKTPVTAPVTNSPLGNLLVTGGTGYFGRAFVRRMLDLGVERVCVLCHSETGRQALLSEVGEHERLRLFQGDVRDVDRLRFAMQGCDTVVHAAALKRVEVGEYDSEEMFKTNVDGSRNVIQAATEAGVSRVVGLSTDKAFDPANTYGTTKLAMERLFLGANNARGSSGPRFAVTRYGNVAGSTGSVIPTWREQIARGGVMVIRDIEATRFWMTRTEAVDLVVRTIQTMKGGELVIPELPAYRLGDLMMAMNGDGYPCRSEPLGAGEKRHEGMAPGKTSDVARRMSIEELKEGLAHV